MAAVVGVAPATTKATRGSQRGVGWVLGMWTVGSCQELSREKRAAARGQVGPRAALLSTFRNVIAVSADAPLWVMLRLKAGKVPALVDTGAVFLRALWRGGIFVFDRIALFFLSAPCAVLADGTRGEVTNAVRLHVKLLDFAWDHEFKVLNGVPFPIILGLDFLRRNSMIVDVADIKFSFGFAPHCVGEFGARSEEVGGDTPARSFGRSVWGSVRSKRLGGCPQCGVFLARISRFVFFDLGHGQMCALWNRALCRSGLPRIGVRRRKRLYLETWWTNICNRG